MEINTEDQVDLREEKKEMNVKKFVRQMPSIREIDEMAENNKRRRKTVLTWSVFFPKYGVDISETERGDLAIKCALWKQ